MRIWTMTLCVIGTVASATELQTWGSSGTWDILVDPPAGNGCLAQRDFDDGIRVQIGAVPAREGGFFAAYHSDWTHIEDGAVGILNFDFGDARFAGDVVGKHSGDLPGGYAFFDNPNFVTEFAKRNAVTIWGKSEQKVEISLSGTSKAIDAVLGCQKEQPEPASN